MDDDYLKNYMRKRFGGSLWPILIFAAVIIIIGLLNSYLQLGWF